MMHEKSETLLMLQLKYGMPQRMRLAINAGILFCSGAVGRICLLYIRSYCILGGLRLRLAVTNMWSVLKITPRPPGEMASRLTTNQEIAGSTPAVVILFLLLI
jgi:hypothetical protein